LSQPWFGTSLRRDASHPRGLNARIEAQLVERLEEAIDLVCLDAMVRARREAGRPAPVESSQRDREEFVASTADFLRRLRTELLAGLSPDEASVVQALAERSAGGDPEALMALQVALARQLPDYWQRFERASQTYTGERVRSGGQRRSVLDRLLGR
jgi:hypothetical protein